MVLNKVILILTVLISTYWNVNTNFLSCSLSPSESFNLNLLECKYVVKIEYKLIRKVLISTYWNVNDLAKKAEHDFDIVLISTYWNVNSEELNTLEDAAMVLISTYWNVNSKRVYIRRLSSLGFNLNLLECKYGVQLYLWVCDLF